MGTLYSPSWPTLTALKQHLRADLTASGYEIKAECASAVRHGESYWHVAIRTKNDDIVPAGSVVALVYLVHSPRADGYGAGYKDMDEFACPSADGVTAKFLSVLTPLPAPVEGEPRSLQYAREWRAQAAIEAGRRTSGAAFRKSLAPGSTFLLPHANPKGPYTVHEVRANGTVRASCGYGTFRVSKAHLEKAVPA